MSNVSDFCNAKNLTASNFVILVVLPLQARDPSVHAAILAHLNQKYGSGSAAADPSSAEKNKQVSRVDSDHVIILTYVCQRRCDPVLSKM